MRHEVADGAAFANELDEACEQLCKPVRTPPGELLVTLAVV